MPVHQMQSFNCFKMACPIQTINLLQKVKRCSAINMDTPPFWLFFYQNSKIGWVSIGENGLHPSPPKIICTLLPRDVLDIFPNIKETLFNILNDNDKYNLLFFYWFWIVISHFFFYNPHREVVAINLKSPSFKYIIKFTKPLWLLTLIFK